MDLLDETAVEAGCKNDGTTYNWNYDTDEGASWSVMDDELKPVRPHYSISKLFDGEYLVVPSVPYLDVEKTGIELPEPAAV